VKVSVVGTGYVGIVTGACLAELGHVIICVDVDKKKVNAINGGKAPIFESGLDGLIRKNVRKKRLSATRNLENAVLESEITFICVGTPSKESGETDLKYVFGAAQQIGKVLRKKKGRHLVIVKSTVPLGTSEKISEILGEKRVNFGICMNPEFLREGNAVYDFMKPDRIVIGCEKKKDALVLKKLYTKINTPVLITNLRTAEMIKYASNSFLATKVSFINEIGNICKKLGIDVYEVANGMGMDKRIGPYFLQAGAGFGGSCFPKDVSSLVYEAKKIKYGPRLLESALEINREQPLKMLELLRGKIGSLDGKRIGVLGLAFKENTDDIRESPANTVIKRLKEEGAMVHAYDPKAVENMRKIHADINYEKSAADVIKKSDALLILTEWREFASIKTDKPMIDGRHIIKKSLRGKNYDGLCW